MAETATKLWVPEGPLAKRVEVYLPPEFMKMLMVFADAAMEPEVHLSIFCTHCKSTPVGQNARSDARWIMACACTTYIGANPVKPS